MPQFSPQSRARLDTCHNDLRDLFYAVVRHFDCTIVCGHRTTAEQQALYAKGRTVPGQIVTNCDGLVRKSRHQTLPSVAVDVVPYPIDWDNLNRFHEMAGWVQAMAVGMQINVRWGGHWRTLKDYPHWELLLPEDAT